MIATFGLAILDSFWGRVSARAMSWKQFALGLVLVFLVGADYIAIQITRSWLTALSVRMRNGISSTIGTAS